MSTRCVRVPLRASSTASAAAVVVLAVPPFWFVIAMIFIGLQDNR